MFDMYNQYTNPNNDTDVKPKDRRKKLKSQSNALNAGGTLVIIIFVVLCLTIFGLLAFATSFADKKLADKNLLSVSQYYEADAEAERTLARVFGELYGIKPLNADITEKQLSAISEIKISSVIETSDGKIEVSYSIPVNDMQTIECVIDFYTDAQTENLKYEIIKWQVVITGNLDYSDSSFDYIWSGEL